MIVHDVVQRSPQWTALRTGRLGGSQAAAMLATTGKGEAASRRQLRVQIALEQLTGRSQDTGYQTAAMREGIAREPLARAAYEAATGQLVTEVGYVSHDTLAVGGSPDGFLDGGGLVELKCPTAATHLESLATGAVPDAYAKQLLHLFFVTGAHFADFVSFSPDFPPALQLQIVRVVRDEAQVALYARLVGIFLAEVAACVATVTALGAAREVA
jgi:exodeoxyribonuclease (lambda-induced)